MFLLTLETVSKPELQLAKTDPKKTEGIDAADPAPDAAEEPEAESEFTAPKRPAVDPVRSETLNILSDLVELSKAPRTASSK